jgi:voltage-gated potassium channel
MLVSDNLKFSILLILIIILTGTFGYHFIEQWPIFDSLYMTVITLTTIGFMEVHDLSMAGRAFTIALVFFGVGALTYAFKNATSAMIEGGLKEILGRKRMQKKMGLLKNHYIICGYGRMGKIVYNEMKLHQKQVVAIEKESSRIPVDDPSLLLYKGDATEDKTLLEVGIKQAEALIAVLSSDAENLYVVLSARGLNPKLKIIARALNDTSEQKLLRAGADRVIAPNHIGAMKIAYSALKPNVIDFVEFVTTSGNLDLRMEELVVEKGSHLSGVTLAQSNIRKDMGIMIVAIKRVDGKMVFNPSFDSAIQDGDTLIALGQAKELKKLEKIVRA